MKNSTLAWLVALSTTVGTTVIAETGSSAFQDKTQGRAKHEERGDSMARDFRTRDPHICLANDLIGVNVASPQGEIYGKIDDVVIHPGGHVAYAVVAAGGILGIGEKLLAVPWSAVSCTGSGLASKDADPNADRNDIGADARDRSREKVTLSISKDRLKGAPGFDKKNWPEMANVEWAKDVDAYYAELDGERRSLDRRAAEAGARRDTTIWKLTDLKGQNVESPDETKLGDIQDVAIDTNGRVSYVVLSFGGALGIGDKRVAVPWEALRFQPDADNGKRRAILDTTKERIEQAPRIRPGKDSEEQMRDPAWIESVYGYYSVDPYWPTAERNGNGRDTQRTLDPNRTDPDRTENANPNQTPPKKK